ncbi:dihydrolipoyllysine-residue acetyltransferase [Marinihelvus fidelis]|uniref:Dihydrolipoamide acetyltransferase component of pyruvate dehydrogenase complex n=1 Tax=Marinihelvus fidelis TaxID=2613842 RepID=A0A5N0TAQ4_9GAMM|nr:dihydrolipoyllysine-residue acetyltransferase [Marinihelvus fidelis]KAA9130429.1 dihydrolipoyllysine-residue acetyltransferase [Marinihelvus fidelis]
MAEKIEVKVPDVGDFEDIPVIEVLVSVGDTVEEEDSLVTLESDKATMEVPSPAAGTIVELKVKLDDTVSEGDVVAVLEVSGEGGETDNGESGETEAAEAPAAEAAAPAEPEKQPEPEARKAEADKPAEKAAPAPSAGPRQSPPVPIGADTTLPDRVPYASPAIRAFARELGVDLFKVSGTGRKGRIQREDVSGFVKQALAGGAGAAAAGGGGGLDVAPPPKIDFSKFGETEVQELSRIKKISGKNLHRNWVTIPHVTHNDEADITALEAFRNANKAQAKAQGFNLTPLVFLIKGVVSALKKHPNFNASLDPTGENLILKRYFNIGIAVDTPDGLVVPVIRDCDKKGVMELAKELGDVSVRARDGKLKPADWQGACFSISSLGGIGGTDFTPIINSPEVAILGVSRSKMTPVWDGEVFRPRLMLPMSLSYDHRVIDGAQAARFCRTLAGQLEGQGLLSL